MRKVVFYMLIVLTTLIMSSCGGQSQGQGRVQDGVDEIEVVPKVMEPKETLDEPVDFTEEGAGTPIMGRQGNPKDQLVGETPPDF